jgi:hypothetical protein
MAKECLERPEVSKENLGFQAYYRKTIKLLTLNNDEIIE